VSSESSPIVPYWHIWTDADGIRHQSPSALTEFHKAPIQHTAAPQWIGAQTRHDATACPLHRVSVPGRGHDPDRD
jgi:hypothetical protein